jgi:hypothetical protein
VQIAVSFLKIPSMGTPYSVREMLFQRLKECLALLVKVSQITDSEVPFPAQHIPLQGFNQHIRNIIAGVNNGWQSVQRRARQRSLDQVVQFQYGF